LAGCADPGLAWDLGEARYFIGEGGSPRRAKASRYDGFVRPITHPDGDQQPGWYRPYEALALRPPERGERTAAPPKLLRVSTWSRRREAMRPQTRSQSS